MKSFSSPVISSQLAPHEQLPTIWAKRRSSIDQTPIASHSIAAWQALETWFLSNPMRILDLGCGTGESTQRLAGMHPQAHILGVDRSADRLDKAIDLRSHVKRIRADQYDVLRILQLAQAQVSKVYLLYPNPSPKPEHLLRRWHAHPIMPCLLASTPNIELRTNWGIYADEFALALAHFGWQQQTQTVEQYLEPLSPFEAKYQASGHKLWRVLGSRTATT